MISSATVERPPSGPSGSRLRGPSRRGPQIRSPRRSAATTAGWPESARDRSAQQCRAMGAGRQIGRCLRLAITAAVLLGAGASPTWAAGGIHKIRHVVIIMQENRSFDNYFGTFPGADGIARRHGRPTVCLPVPALGHCIRPSYDPHDSDFDVWHDAWSFRDDFDHGRMDGFARVAAICLDSGHGAALPARGVEGGGRGRRWATTISARSRTTGRTRAGSCSRITCSSRSRAGACRLICGWCPSGRHAVCRRPTRSAASANITAPQNPPDIWSRAARRPQLRVDRPDVSAAPASRELGLLRQDGRRARLRERRRHLSSTSPWRRVRRGSGTRSRTSPRFTRTISSATSGTSARSTAPPRSGHLAGRVVGGALRVMCQASIRRTWKANAARRSSPAW